MKIIFLIRSLAKGGAERQLVTLAAGLRKRGHEVEILTFYEGNAFEQIVGKADVKVGWLGKSSRWEIFCFFRKLISYLRRSQTDIVHSYLGGANVIVALAKFFIPGIKIVWGQRATELDFRYYDWFSYFIYRAEGFLTGIPDLIIINSYKGRDCLVQKKYPAKKIRVIHNGIDTEYFKPSAIEGICLRKQWDVRENERVIGLVGRLDPMKDHLTFFEAVSFFIKEEQNVKFICVGDGPEPYKRFLLGKLSEMNLENYVIMVPSREDITGVYNALDVVTLSSAFGEGFPNAVGEAMACGVPCVVTDVGDSGLIVGSTGIVVPPKNAVKLGKAWSIILARLELEKNSLKSRVREKIELEFSAERMLEHTEKELLGLAISEEHGIIRF